MKIGIVSQSYYPRYGGVTEHVHRTAVELRRRGHEVTIITSHFRGGDTERVPDVERIGYNMLIPFNRAFVDLAVGIRLRGQLRALLRRHGFDVLHTHAPLVPTLPLIAIETAERPQVGTFHTTGGPSSAARDSSSGRSSSACSDSTRASPCPRPRTSTWRATSPASTTSSRTAWTSSASTRSSGRSRSGATRRS